MAFSASDAAFEGFRIVRRRPLAVLAWALAYIVFFAVGFAVVGQPALAIIRQAEALQGGAEPTAAELVALSQGYGLVIGVIWPLMMLLGVMLSAAVARAVLQPKASAFGYLRLGMDELRLLGAMIILFLLLLLYYVVAIGICVGLGVYAHTSGQGWVWLLCVLAGIGAFLGLVWLAVRLSLMAPIIVAENRFALFSSFALTKGRFWPLLGMTLLSFVMTIVVSLLGTIINLPIRFSLAGPLSQIAQPADLLPVLQQHIGLVVAWGVVNAIISALQMVVLYAPFAAAYRDIKGVEPA
ncbi:hypothetical protein [Brevundimonas sp.]|jgi:hypothetical protein|uniref:hypothetical protein n=1 Tax=Brevundimonas sp. TaxID=1871086 RepID=UPI003784C3EB